MRFAVTIGVWVVILSLLTFLFSLRAPEKTEISEEKAAHTEAAFEVTATFAVEKDPFALDIGESAGAFEILLDGKSVFSAEEGIKDRVSFMTDTFDITEGKHELFVKATPSDTSISQAVRVRALMHGNPVSDETFWFAPGQSVNASHIFNIEIKGGGDEH